MYKLGFQQIFVELLFLLKIILHRLALGVEIFNLGVERHNLLHLYGEDFLVALLHLRIVEQ